MLINRLQGYFDVCLPSQQFEERGLASLEHVTCLEDISIPDLNLPDIEKKLASSNLRFCLMVNCFRTYAV